MTLIRLSRCSRCHEPGHNRRTCPYSDVELYQRWRDQYLRLKAVAIKVLEEPIETTKDQA